jgi:hypothetical protein
MGTSYPVANDTDTSLYVAKNGAETTLNSTIDNAVTSITVANLIGYPADGIITIDAEAIKYTSATTGVNGTFNSCTRGYDGTTAAGHSANAKVRFSPVADHHNVLKDAIIALEKKVGNNTGGASATTMDAGQLSSGSSATITALTGSGLVTGAGLRDSRGSAGANLSMVKLGSLTLRCILRDGYTPSQAGVDNVAMRLNGDAAANYKLSEFFSTNDAAFGGAFPAAGTNLYLWPIPGTTAGVANGGSGWLEINGLNSANYKMCTFMGRYGSTAAANSVRHGMGCWFNAAVVTSIGFLSLAGPGTLTLNGTIDFYGYY